jgi:hypothetical protein
MTEPVGLEAGSALTQALSAAISDLRLKAEQTSSGVSVTNPCIPENGIVTIDYKDQYLTWQREEFDHWNFDVRAAETVPFITAKLRSLLT